MLDARIHTSSDNLCFNTLMVLDEQDRPVGHDPTKVARIQETLTRVLLQPEEFPSIVKRRLPRTLRHFRVPTSVEIVNEPNSPHTEIRVMAADRPGLLARLGLIFMEEGIVVHNAKIATLGERIDDVFFVTDEDHQPIEATERTAALREAICGQLDEQVGL